MHRRGSVTMRSEEEEEVEEAEKARDERGVTSTHHPSPTVSPIGEEDSTYSIIFSPPWLP